MDSIVRQQQNTRDHVAPGIVYHKEHVVSHFNTAYRSEHVPFFGTASFFEDPAYITFVEQRSKYAQGMQDTQNVQSTQITDTTSVQRWSMRTPATVFALMLLVALGGFSSMRFVGQLFALKGEVLGVSTDGYAHVQDGLRALQAKNFSASASSFAQAHEKFSRASSEIDELSDALVSVSRYIPGASKLNSAKHVVDAATDLTVAAEALNGVVADFSEIKNPFATNAAKSNTSLLTFFDRAQKNVTVAAQHLGSAQTSLAQVNVDDLPQEYRDRFLTVKTSVPLALSAVDEFQKNNDLITDLLGGNGLRQYLFLFQNNQEMRPTGGFIGSYGLLDLRDGYVEDLFIEGIYNPDGQLTQKIVPPRPIQKISAAWSLHDSNWFADFPVSAEKAISFYEKTGGPTVDGVITLTPVVMERLLEITGPIYMEEYDVTLTHENFIELTQYEVEEDYDKEENQPKKILASLAPIVIEKILAPKDLETTVRVVDALSQSLREKHILLYMRDGDAQRIIEAQGWGGRIIAAPHDYLSVVNTNINGFKTDGVIDEEIMHESVIAQDGSMINTVTITRTHNGGNTGREWWDRVNTNYMRLYVPQGAQLLSVEGHTPEVVTPPLDYDALQFRRDDDVARQENATRIHEQSGTRIYDEGDKTVFGNWVYVSPQETVTVRYQYRLPFRITVNAHDDEDFTSHSVLFQKQHGSVGSQIHSRIIFPSTYELSWQTDNDVLSAADNGVTYQSVLSQDHFFGMIFKPRK